PSLGAVVLPGLLVYCSPGLFSNSPLASRHEWSGCGRSPRLWSRSADRRRRSAGVPGAGLAFTPKGVVEPLRRDWATVAKLPSAAVSVGHSPRVLILTASALKLNTPPNFRSQAVESPSFVEVLSLRKVALRHRLQGNRRPADCFSRAQVSGRGRRCEPLNQRDLPARREGGYRVLFWLSGWCPARRHRRAGDVVGL